MPLSTHVEHLSMCKSVCICFTDPSEEGAMSSDRYLAHSAAGTATAGVFDTGPDEGLVAVATGC